MCFSSVLQLSVDLEIFNGGFIFIFLLFRLSVDALLVADVVDATLGVEDLDLELESLLEDFNVNLSRRITDTAVELLSLLQSDEQDDGTLAGLVVRECRVAFLTGLDFIRALFVTCF